VSRCTSKAQNVLKQDCMSEIYWIHEAIIAATVASCIHYRRSVAAIMQMSTSHSATFGGDMCTILLTSHCLRCKWSPTMIMSMLICGISWNISGTVSFSWKVLLFWSSCDLVIFFFMPIQPLAQESKLVFYWCSLHSGDDPQTGCLNDRLFDCGDCGIIKEGGRVLNTPVLGAHRDL